jgi:hypothetical protein
MSDKYELKNWDELERNVGDGLQMSRHARAGAGMPGVISLPAKERSVCPKV